MATAQQGGGRTSITVTRMTQSHESLQEGRSVDEPISPQPNRSERPESGESADRNRHVRHRITTNTDVVQKSHWWNPFTWSSNTVVAWLAILVTIAGTLIFGIPSWQAQSEANRLAQQANRLAEESNRITMWQACESAVEIQDTPTCIELLKAGPGTLEKRALSVSSNQEKVSVSSGQCEYEYPRDFDQFTRYNGLLAKFLEARMGLGRELDAFHQRRQQYEDDARGPENRHHHAEEVTLKPHQQQQHSQQKFQQLAESILLAERRIAALLSLVSSPPLKEDGPQPPQGNNDWEPFNMQSRFFYAGPTKCHSPMARFQSAGLPQNYPTPRNWTALGESSAGQVSHADELDEVYPWNVLTVNGLALIYSWSLFLGECLLFGLCILSLVCCELTAIVLSVLLAIHKGAFGSNTLLFLRLMRRFFPTLYMATSLLLGSCFGLLFSIFLFSMGKIREIYRTRLGFRSPHGGF